MDDPNQPYSCNQWGQRHEYFGSPAPLLTNDSGYTIFNWFNTGSAFPSVVFLDHTITVDYKANFTGGFNSAKNRINNLLDDCGVLCSTEPVLGCTDEGACNYDEGASDDDGSCEYDSCAGCTDPLADNYDPNASIDDDSCSYPVNISLGYLTASTIDIMHINSTDIGGFQFTVTDNPDAITITGASGGRAEDADFEVSTSELGIVIGFSFSGTVIPPGEGLLTTLSYDGIGPTELCLEDIIISDENGQSVGVANADCAILDIVASPGDTNLDGNVNVQDVVVLLNFILGQDEPTDQEFLNGDMNEDGILNVQDVVTLINLILGTARVIVDDDELLANVEFIKSNNDLIVRIDTEFDFSGVQFNINTPYKSEVNLRDNSHISLVQHFINNEQRVVAYSMFNESFDGHQAEFVIDNGSMLSRDDVAIIISHTSGKSFDIIYSQSNIDYIDDYNFSIIKIYPNPFNPTTDIDFSLQSDAYVKLIAYNAIGQEVGTIFEGYQDSGIHSYTWDASINPSGIYYIRLISDNVIKTQKVMLLK